MGGANVKGCPAHFIILILIVILPSIHVHCTVSGTLVVCDVSVQYNSNATSILRNKSVKYAGRTFSTDVSMILLILLVELHHKLLDREGCAQVQAGDGDAPVRPELHPGQHQAEGPQCPRQTEGNSWRVYQSSRLPCLLRNMS